MYVLAVGAKIVTFFEGEGGAPIGTLKECRQSRKQIQTPVFDLTPNLYCII